MLYTIIKILRDFALCSLAALILFFLSVYGIEQHQIAMEKQAKHPIEVRR